MPARPGLTAKRWTDVAVSGAALATLSPLMSVLTGMVLVVHGWPPFFRQDRPGLHGRVFRIVKLRTMTEARDAAGRLLPDEDRLTPFGRLLRRTSLDELPELWNVLVGDMSLVGPRPLLVRYLDRYSEEQMRRHDMPPGLTGLVQVNGRNGLGWEEKFDLDLWYVDHWSYGLDLLILARTVTTVLRGSGVSSEGAATMPEFLGTEVG
ncbi:MAG: sugar transferase [Sandaracinaceae bacterium]